ncbi:enoyl-CoA hydratase/isomerase family protein [Oceanobacillus sp. CAU 1775]
MKNKVIYNISNNIATITLNRTDALNALDNDMIWGIYDFLETCKVNDDVRVIVIEGNGKAFCSGDDLVTMATEDRPNPTDKVLELRQGYPMLVEQIRSVPKPVICKVHKYALGAGFEIALASDMIIAREDTKFGLPFVLRGMASGTYLLQKFIGYHRATELLFTGDMLTAQKAKEWGIVNKVVDEVMLDAEVQTMAEKLSKGATRAIGLMKASLNNGENQSMHVAFQEQVLATTLSFQTEDYAEGINAFKEKREANFKGK